MMKKTIALMPNETTLRPTPFATPSAVSGAETAAGSTGATSPP